MAAAQANSRKVHAKRTSRANPSDMNKPHNIDTGTAPNGKSPRAFAWELVGQALIMMDNAQGSANEATDANGIVRYKHAVFGDKATARQAPPWPIAAK